MTAQAEPMVDPATLELARDLADEQRSLEAVLAGLTETDWHRATPAIGWDIHDQLAHIALVEEQAVTAVTDPEAFAIQAASAAADPDAFESALHERGRTIRGPELLRRWVEARRTVIVRVRTMPPGSRLTWFGPSMSARSFLTARLMETWSHGVDIRDALGLITSVTPALRHIAHLGVSTQGWSYVVRGLEPDPTPVFVELTGPGDKRWTWGDPNAGDRVCGSALDFCLVVTQRRHWKDTNLRTGGPSAMRWMDLAQAFAGPATTTVRGRGTTEGVVDD